MASGDRIQKHDLTGGYLHKFKLYETRSNFYIVGRDKNRALWRVLKIDRLEPSELNILEDSTTYSEHECCDLLKRIHEGNRSIGGLKFVTTCYGIVGFIKFLGPYYMMLITKRRKIGAICGHVIYSITKSEMIPIPNSTVLSNMDNSKNDNRYKKLLRTVDLTKDFFFSYSYHVMHSLQKNLCDNEAGQLLYETMFVWNEFLTRVIRNHLKNTLWTVALVHGFFNQAKLSISGRDFLLTLIARRSRHFAGTSKSISVLELLGKVAVYAIDLTDIFYCHITPTLSLEEQLNLSNSEENDGSECTLQDHCNKNKDADHLEREIINGNDDASGHCAKTLRIQKGVLRTNCIDCLDRTNVAQYAFGLVALGHQLHALGLMDVPNVDLDSPLADDLMGIYETMGDTLALQYGGSAAHNKIFSERRGQWKAATQSQELFRTIQRYCSNAYMDARKQDAINVFLGNFQPQQDKPALWELGLDQHYNVGRRGSCLANESPRSIMKRSLSDGNILFERNSSVSAANIEKQKTANQPLADQIRENKGLLDSTLEMSNQPFPNKMRGNKGFLDSTLEMSNQPLPDQMRGNKGLSDSTPEMSTCDTDISYSRYTPSIPRRHLFTDLQQNLSLESSEPNSVNEHGDSFDYSNFLDVEWLSSSGNSCEEETYESFRSALIHSPTTTLSLENVVSGVTATDASESGSSMKGEELSDELAKSSGIPSEFPDSFVQWVTSGGLFFN